MESPGAEGLIRNIFMTTPISRRYTKRNPIMCEANVYLVEEKETKLIMEAVDTVEPEGDGIKLVSIFGDQKIIKARIHSLSLVDNKIYLKE
jgi:predicted RNA-binding protein